MSPEIDSLRARVERQSAEQQVTNAANELEKARLTLARITGLPPDQKFTTAATSYRPVNGLTEQSAIAHAREYRSDLLSAAASIREAESAFGPRREKNFRRLISRGLWRRRCEYRLAEPGLHDCRSDFGPGLYRGSHPGGHRSSSDQPCPAASGVRRSGRPGCYLYDVRVAWLDTQASDSSVNVAESNRALAERALAQSQDRYLNGVTNYLEVLRAQEAVTTADENYIRSVYSFNVAKIALARAMGAAETHIQDFFRGK